MLKISLEQGSVGQSSDKQGIDMSTSESDNNSANLDVWRYERISTQRSQPLTPKSQGLISKLEAYNTAIENREKLKATLGMVSAGASLLGLAALTGGSAIAAIAGALSAAASVAIVSIAAANFSQGSSLTESITGAIDSVDPLSSVLDVVDNMIKDGFGSETKDAKKLVEIANKLRAKGDPTKRAQGFFELCEFVLEKAFEVQEEKIKSGQKDFTDRYADSKDHEGMLDASDKADKVTDDIRNGNLLA
jgi:hypothetical protein